MKTSKRAEIRASKRYLFIFIAVLVVSATFLIFADVGGTAFASDDLDAQTADTFSVLFPHDSLNYVQSNDPTLIASNETYLIIYDKTASAMFVRGGDRRGTYAFPLNIEGVEYIKAVGNTAFIHAHGENYTVNLKDTASVPVKAELSSPENANYFRSDGKYLYAKNGSGAVTIYDETLVPVRFKVGDGESASYVTVDNHTHVDSTNNPVFAGNIVLAGNDHLLYFFTTYQSDPYFVVYDPVTRRELVYNEMRDYISEAYVGDNIIVGQLAGGATDPNQKTRLVGIDKSTGTTLFPSDISPDSFCVYGNRLYTIEGKQIMTYRLEQSAGGEYTGFRKISTISMAGNDPDHLDNPSDVISLGKNIAVADTNNKRVGIINSASIMTTVSLESAPLRLTSDSFGIFALCENNKVVKIESNTVVQTLPAENATDITYLDKLYYICSDGLYTIIGGECLKLADTEGARRLTSAKDGTNLYILKDDGIYVYSSNGTHVRTLCGDFSTALDIAVDYAGQIFALREDGFDVYANDNGIISKFSSTEFANATAHVSANSLAIDEHSVYFSTAECLIGKSETISFTKETYISVPYSPADMPSYHFARLKPDTPSYAIPSDGRSEGIFTAPAETVLVIEGAMQDSGFAYALLGGEFFIIREADYDTVNTNAASGDFSTKRNTYLYTLPGVASGRVSALTGTRFTPVSDCADYEDSKWIRVNYNDRIYFVLADDCGDYIELIPEENKLYGRAKAKRVGGLVSIYSDANEGSQTLAEIVDGTRIEVLDTLDAFYLIRYENTVGYMRKADVQIDGLTTVQIVAIAVSCIVAVAGIGIFIAIEVTKKKSEEAERRAEKKQK